MVIAIGVALEIANSALRFDGAIAGTERDVVAQARGAAVTPLHALSALIGAAGIAYARAVEHQLAIAKGGI